MQRDTALVPLSHDHQHALARALRLRRAAESGGALGAAVDEFLEFIRVEQVHHLREEEERLFPVLADADPRLEPLVQRAAGEHLRLRLLVRRLQLARGEAGAGGDERALRETALELAVLLHDHVRFEERELFERAQELLDASELAGLGLATRLPDEQPVAEAGSERMRARVLWLRDPRATDGIETDELDATPVRLAAGQARAAHEVGREVAYVFVDGDGRIDVGGEAMPVAAPACVVVAAGEDRSLEAGPAGLRYVTVHRRGPLQLGD